MPVTLLVALLSVVAPPEARVVMPASGVVIDGLPLDGAARWEAEGTVQVTAREARPVDRLLGLGAGGERKITFEIRREACVRLPPGSTSPWPTLGYEGLRTALPERRALKSCKVPDLTIELRFPAGVDSDEAALFEAADRWESTVATLHRAYATVRLDVMAALALGARVELAGEAAELARLSGPITLRGGLGWERGDAAPWTVRELGGHDVLTLLVPTRAGLALQIVPFSIRFDCEAALEAALRSQPPAPPGTANPPLPLGWMMARPVGVDGAAFCADSRAGGIVAIGGARVPREVWLPLAAPLLGRLGEALARHP